MAPLQENSSQRKQLVCLLLLFITPTFISAAQSQNHHLFSKTRLLLELQDDSSEPIITTKNQPKLVKPPSSKNQTKTSNLSLKNQTKLIKTSNIKNQTKLIIKTSNIKNQTKLSIKTSNIKNQTSNLALKNQTKGSSFELIKTSPKNQTNSSADQSKIKKQHKVVVEEEEEEEDDLVSELTDLPSRFQETFLPDMERISKTSKIYLNKYNTQFTKGFKPYVGNKYASTLASVISFAFIIIPLILVSLLFSKITAYFSIQKFLIFIQIYLSIYFTILALSSLMTGLEPLKFFYATSHSTYVCVQLLQTLGYVLYLLLLLMYLVLVFSTESGVATKLLGLGQTLVGLAVGLHYYITVFHRAVLHQPPKASWKVHALYAASFLLISLLGRLDRRKKAYLEEGGLEGKKS
ncbi:uncharacterized protein LOC131001423 [Salvia miltiorrhiza]|uniref:uncharacterized protein LOC131001423 n=1 Tax=Salvia miltiorrhiza TaxID=226208 RepID=UPI0025AC4D35|nr:uncharacterized protein LOC131001423 [Salvia miltiorrhiza]